MWVPLLARSGRSEYRGRVQKSDVLERLPVRKQKWNVSTVIFVSGGWGAQGVAEEERVAIRSAGGQTGERKKRKQEQSWDSVPL